MQTFIDRLKAIRASNLIFAALLPLILYFIFTSRNYVEAITVILGVEDNPLTLLSAFLMSVLIGFLGFWGLLKLNYSLRPDIKPEQAVKAVFISKMCFCGQLLLLLFTQLVPVTQEFLYSILINWGDAKSSPWIIIVDQKFAITDETKAYASQILSFWLKISLLLPIFSFFLSFAKRSSLISLPGSLVRLLIFLINFSFLSYILILSHAGFAVGLMTCIRAAILAYLLASVLGLTWALLTNLKPSLRSNLITSCIGVALLAFAVLQFAQPKIEFELVGSIDGRVGIVKGTPQSTTDVIRYGEFLNDKPEKPVKIRSLRSTEQAIKLLEDGKISGAVLPPGDAKAFDTIWKSNYLPTLNKNLGTAAGIIGIILLLLVIVGIISDMHPLHAFSDFFVDTIRGVPMLVIVIYIGLPLAGAVKDASYEYIDMSIMTRGVLAIGIGYSAYMAEIFRAGIEAVPRGQIEAAKTIGLRDWQIARFIVFPQAVAIVLPALGNEFIAMLKDTALLSLLSLRELTQRMREHQAETFQAFPAFNSAALIYIILTLIAASCIKSIDKLVNKKNIRKE